MEFLEYFKEREKDLIKAVGEKDWIANKVYYVEEIAEIVNEWQLKFLPIQRVSNWGELKNACLHSKRHDTFMACLHKDTDDAMVCFSPAHCPMIKKWSKCNKNSPCC
jgi:hypothetical protein